MEGEKLGGQPPSSFNYLEIHNLSVEVMETLEGEQLKDAIAAMAMSLARLMSPKQPMDTLEDIKATKDLMEFASAYFGGGGMN